MASSFYDQIPDVINIARNLNPKFVLDIGKGFGKYGFLFHEYFGIDASKKIDHKSSMMQQSNLQMDAIEVDDTLMLPHLSHFYDKVHFGDVFKLAPNISKRYDLVLMIDVVEHLEKQQTLNLIKKFVQDGSVVLIATPIEYFNQHLYESVYEEHISHWTLNDFKGMGELQVQYKDSGALYLLSKEKVDIPGFGNSWMKKAKRLFRIARTELKHL